jgi:hypothetical protein
MPSTGSYRAKWALMIGGLWLAVWPAHAVERSLLIVAPATVAAQTVFTVTVTAGTDAGQGEHVGLLQVDCSTDQGRTWKPMCYLDKLGPQVRQSITLQAGPEGGDVRVRARAAFRDGLAGDVDYAGAALRWHAGWAQWSEPPAKTAVILVRGK